MSGQVTRRRFVQASLGLAGCALTGTAAVALQPSDRWTRPGGLVPPGEW
ncbi:MAG: twin-arginine translocation signal domain-containing protein [Vicinamibacterales bacterium]